MGLGIVTGIGRHQCRRAPTQLHLLFHRFGQQVPVARTLVKNVQPGHDLMFRFRDLHQLAEFGRLARLPLANDFRVRLKHTNNLAGAAL